jgi:hypothetical protein
LFLILETKMIHIFSKKINQLATKTRAMLFSKNNLNKKKNPQKYLI